MRVAVLSESPADEAAARNLVDGILGTTTARANLPPLRTRGWPSVAQVLPIVIKHLHFRTDADALAVVVDANASTVHVRTHEATAGMDQTCRLCRLQSAVGATLGQLKPVQGRDTIRTAVGVAVPAIEAWYLCGRDPGVSEASWLAALSSRKPPFTKSQLKKDVYGTDRPSLALEKSRAAEETRRIVEEGLIGALEKTFPGGFGPFALAIRSW